MTQQHTESSENQKVQLSKFQSTCFDLNESHYWLKRLSAVGMKPPASVFPAGLVARLQVEHDMVW